MIERKVEASGFEPPDSWSLTKNLVPAAPNFSKVVPHECDEGDRLEHIANNTIWMEREKEYFYLVEPRSRSTESAARMPRYCASSKIEKPLRSELANRIREREFLSFCRSSEKTVPTTGRAIA